MPSFSITPARITEPAVGAWVWASGSQVCTGNNGTFTAKAMANAKNSQRPVAAGKSARSAITVRSKVSRSTPLSLARNAVAMMPTSMNADPNIVNRKNLSAAYCRLS